MSYLKLYVFCISACNCNPDGSLGVSCDENGRCVCRPGVLGVKCDQCGENRFNLSAGCTRKYDVIDDIVCYNILNIKPTHKKTPPPGIVAHDSNSK